MDYVFGQRPKAYVGSSTWRGGFHRKYNKKNGKSNGVAKGGLYNACRLTGEKLFHDVTTTGAAVDTTPLIINCNVMDVGAAVGQRTGRRIEMQSIYVRMETHSGTTPTGCAIRVILFYDKQTNGAQPGATDVLDANRPEAMLNMDSRQRLEVLADKTYVQTVQSGGAATAGFVKTFNFHKIFRKLRCRDTIYSGTGSGIADIATGGLFIMLLSTEAVGVTAPVIDMVTRLRYRS